MMLVTTPLKSDTNILKLLLTYIRLSEIGHCQRYDTLLVKEVFPAFRSHTDRTGLESFNFSQKARSQNYRTLLSQKTVLEV